MEHKQILFAIIGIFVISAGTMLIVSMNSENTGLYNAYGIPKVYGGAARQTYYPYSEGRTISPNVEDAATTSEAYDRTGMSMYSGRATKKIYTTLISCEGQIAEGNIPAGLTLELSFTEIYAHGLNPETDCINAIKLIGSPGWCCRPTRGLK